jgi:hypothetical protein
VLSICWNSFKTVGKAFLMKLVERMPRVFKAVIKPKGDYFEEYKIYFDLNTLLLNYSMCYFIVLMTSLLVYNVGNSKNKNP